MLNLCRLVLFLITFSTLIPDSRGMNFSTRITEDVKSLNSDFPLDVSQVFSEASDVFLKVVGKIIGKKKLLGIDSEWYW